MELYWGQLLEPETFSRNAPPPDAWVTIPAQWRSYTVDGEALSNEGYATYRLRFALSEQAAGQPLALHVGSVATAYRLWINDAEKEGNGVVGPDPQSMKPRNMPKIYYFQPRAGENEIIFQVSNFVQRKGASGNASS